MNQFATEYPAKTGLTKATFVAAAIAWVRGIAKSNVLANADAADFYDDEAQLQTADGEVFALKSYESDTSRVYGVRFELPDKQDRGWRTECIYTELGSRAFLRVRGQCVAYTPAATILTPKKPYIVRQSISDGWGGSDGLFVVRETPHLLSNADVEIATAVVNGSATNFLPCAYISRGQQNKLPVDVDRLAISLSGICHVIVEPSRAFSFDLMEASSRKNPYGGSIGIIAPGGGELARINSVSKTSLFFDLCQDVSVRFLSALAPKSGWEWHDLQEAQARHLRKRAMEGSSQVLEEYEELVQEEISAKDEQIARLKERLETEIARNASPLLDSLDLLPKELCDQIGSEIYEGEFSDRLRFFVDTASKQTSLPVDPRTKEFAKRFVEKTSSSGKANQLTSQIKAASKDGNQMPKQLGQLLVGLGYTKSQDGKHLKFTPKQDLFGLPTETLPSTPSDSQRGGKNRGNEVANSLSLKSLK